MFPEQLALPHGDVGYEQLPSAWPAQDPAQVASVPHDWVQQEPALQTEPAMQPPEVAVQDCPLVLLQAPLASHVPAQRPFGSSMLLAATQVWLPLSQDMHVPVQSASVQQPVLGMQTVVLPLVQDLVDPVQA
jgi:hypothetical protein